MRLIGLNIDGFRNIDGASVEFDSGINVIHGNNAQGKTNLLEAIYYLSRGRSFRTSADADVINFDRDEARISARVFSEEREQEVRVDFTRGRRKRIFANGVGIKTLSELSGRFPTVLFYPSDLDIIREGASGRRRFIDSAICGLRPKYVVALSRHNRLLEQKTRILRDHDKKPALLDILGEFNDGLARTGAEIISYRALFVRLLCKNAAAVHGDFSGKEEELFISYKTMKTVEDPFLPVGELYSRILEHQREHRQAELHSGLCLSGVHKDDLEISINGKSAKAYASQGQTRTAALSMKLAEREIYARELGEPPVLLLDDVLSELDSKRQDFVLNRIMDGQIFITCCGDADVFLTSAGRKYRVEDGRIF